MAEFGSDITEAPEARTAITPKAGVVTESPTTPVDRSGLLNAFATAQEAADTIVQSGNDRKLAAFNRDILKIADAYEQGGIGSSTEANARIRMKLMEALDSTDNPDLQAQYIEAQRSLMGLQGGGAIITQRTDEERRRRALRDSLVANSIVAPDATEDEFRKKEMELVQARQAMTAYQQQIQTIDAEMKNINLSNARREQLNKQKHDIAIETFNKAGKASRDGLQMRMEEVVKSNIPEVEKVKTINDIFEAFVQEVNPMAAPLTGEERTRYLSPFERTRDLYLQLATGELSRSVVENNVATIVKQNEALILADDGLANLVAANNLFSNFDLTGTLTQEANVRFIELFGKNLSVQNSDLPPGIGAGVDIFTDQGEAQAAAEIMKLADESVINDDLKDDALYAFDSILGNIADSEATARANAKKTIPMVQIFANPRYKDFIAEHGGNLENLEEARRVVQEHFFDEVLGMVRKEFTENSIVSPQVQPSLTMPMGSAALQFGDEGTPTPEAVTHRSTDLGVEFIPVNPNNVEASKKARELNQGLGRVINESVHAFAHLNGTGNYRQIWEGVAEDVLGETTQPAGGDAGDNLTIEMFDRGGSLDKAMSDGGFVGDGDFTGATTPVEVAANFVGFDEGEQQKTLTSFIRTATGNNINPTTTAWCAAFVNAALGSVGLSGTDSNVARSFENWGTPVNNPQRGDIAVFERGDETWQGHVGFYVGPSEKEGFVRILGGNQNNKVSIKDFPVSKLLSFRRG